ncbi:MAG: phosphatase PAP2 family protein [Saprospiraceae bacterium]|jgi:membrane-associated phospholipid phosphatase|nr:phosphatase PAP2 family protein [Saprospiraceae bacterium]
MRITFYRFRYIFITLLILWIVGIAVLINIHKGQEVLFLEQHRNSILNTIFSSITQLSEFPVYAIIVTILWLSGRKDKALTILSAGLITVIVSGGLKNFFKDPRPALYFELKKSEVELSAVPGVKLNRGYSSYPSGHTMGAFTLFVTLAYLWPRKHFFGVCCIILGAGVAFSRIYLGQHFLSDVIAGSLVGTYLASFSYFYIFKKLSKNKTKKQIT